MPIRPGNNPNAPKLYVGNQEVNRVYAGTTMVWENTVPPPPPPVASGWTPGTAPTLTVTATHTVSPVVFAPYAVPFKLRTTGGPLTQPADDPTNEAFDPTYGGYIYLTQIASLEGQNFRNDWVGSAQHRRRDLVWGQRATTVLPVGTHTLVHRVYAPNGQWGTTQVTYTVANPNDFFPASRTIRFSPNPSETWSGAPAADAANTFTGPTAMAQAINRYNAIRSTGHVRMCGRAAEYTENTPSMLFTSTIGYHYLFDVFGGDALTINEGVAAGSSPSTGLFQLIGSTDTRYLTVRGWGFIGGWDGVKGYPKEGYPAMANRKRRSYLRHNAQFVRTDPRVFLFDRCDVQDMASTCCSGLQGSANGSPENYDAHWVFKDCEWKNLGDFVAFNYWNLAMLGCRHLDEQGADLGSGGRHQLGETYRSGRGHRFLREPVARTNYLAGNYVETFGGWSGHVGHNTAYGPQPATRLNEQSGPTYGVEGRPGAFTHMIGNVFTGAATSLDNTGDDTGKRPGKNTIVENNLYIAHGMSFTSAAVTNLGPRAIMRNCIMIRPNMPVINATTRPDRNWSKFRVAGGGGMNRSGGFVEPAVHSNTYGLTLRNDPMYAAFNTFVDFSTTANRAAPQIWTDETRIDNFPNRNIGSNVVIAPNRDTPITPTGAIASTAAGFRMLNPWMKMQWEVVNNYTLPNAVANGEHTPLIPYPNDWYNNPLTQSDFDGENHAVRINQTGSSLVQLTETSDSANRQAGAIVVDFQAGGFRLRNTSGSTWASGARLDISLTRGNQTMVPDTLFVFNQAQNQVVRFAGAQPMTTGVPAPMIDFDYRIRPGTTWPLAGSGTNSGGASLPA